MAAGTHDALVELMSTGTTNPSADFYAAVRDGVAAATKAVVTTGQLRPVTVDSAPGIAEGEAPKP